MKNTGWIPGYSRLIDIMMPTEQAKRREGQIGAGREIYLRREWVKSSEDCERLDKQVMWLENRLEELQRPALKPQQPIAPSPQPDDPHNAYFKIAGSDPEINKSSLLALAVAGSKLLYRSLYSTLGKTGADPDAARKIDEAARMVVEQLNSSPVFGQFWKAQAVMCGARFEHQLCQIQNEIERPGGIYKVNPLSFAIRDAKSGEVRYKALVEVL